MSVPSERIVDSTAIGVSDFSKRGGEEIWAWSSVMEVSMEEEGGEIIKRGEIRMRVKQFSLGDVMVSFSHRYGEKDMMEGGVNESGGNSSYESMKTMKIKER